MPDLTGRWRCLASLRPWAWGSGAFLSAVGIVSWALTAPATLRPTGPSLPPPHVAAGPIAETPAAPVPLAWPGDRLDGDSAKRLLLDVLRDARLKLDRVPGYTATFRKRERLRGVLGSEQTLAMKVRHQPFSVYLKFLAPREGKEVVYADGFNDNHLIGHNGGLSRLLVPRLELAPNDPIALLDNRHPITDAGISKLVDRLIGFREMDLTDADATTVLDWHVDADGRKWPRSVHHHDHYDPNRPFAHVEVLYDPDLLIPRRIDSYDWPETGHEGPLDLAESYAYDDLDFDAVLSDLDFDPSNPAYGFSRF